MTTSTRAALATLAFVCVLPVIWPGDIPFINDEPMLIINAVRANAAGRLAESGLVGTFGFTYGPFPTWVYQALTAISHDLVLVAALHAALISVATAGALWWLSRSLGLWAWFAAVPLLSPYFWFDARVLWDNPFLIPLGALAVAGYAANLTSESTWGLRVAVAAMMAILLVHLMGIALVAPLAVHMTVRWRAVIKHRLSVGAILATGVVLAWPYWQWIVTHRAPAATMGPSGGGLLLPLVGARVLSAQELDYFFGPGPARGAALRLAAAVSGIVYALAWGGIAVAVGRIVQAVRHREWSPRAHLATILVAAPACQAIVHAMAGKFEHPQYHNGTWIATTLLAWLAVDFVVEWRSPFRWSAVAATALLAGALLVAVATIAGRLHRTHGTRLVYGPTVANQQRIARELARYSPRSRVVTHVDLYDRYPLTLAVLRELNPGEGGDRPERDLEVRYATDDPSSGAIAVVAR